MKRLVLTVLFFTSAQLIGQNDNFPTIRQKISRANEPIVIHRFEDKNNVCYVVESRVYGGHYAVSGTSTAISCVKAGQ